MVFVTVFRHVPTPVIGTIGTVYDPAFQRFEADLDWLETTGLLVEQFDPFSAPDALARLPAARRLLADEGDGSLPLILVNERVVWRGSYPSRAQLARAVGEAPDREPSAA